MKKITEWLNYNITLNLKIPMKLAMQLGADVFGDTVTVCGHTYFIYCNTIHNVGIIDWCKYYFLRIRGKCAIWRFPMQ